MSDDVRWVVQRREDGLLRTTHGWIGSAEAAKRWESERDALVYAAALATQCVVRAVRRVPAKRRWESNPVGEYLIYEVRESGQCQSFVGRAHEVPPEPSDRWELVPE